MNSKSKQSATKSIIGILLSIILFFSSGVQIPGLDSTADSYFKDSITKAGASYGIDNLEDVTVPKLDGFLGTIGNSASYIKEKSVDFKDTFRSSWKTRVSL